MEPGEIHLWTAGLDLAEDEVRALRASLSADEIERADRFLQEGDRRRFAAARGILRRLLGKYLGRQAFELQFVYGKKGKPALAEGGLSFSLSHCEDRALYAFARERELGVDLEVPRPGLDAIGLASRFFSAQEAERLSALPPGEREASFYRHWTRKEAYSKALGEGLALIAQDPRMDPRFQIEEIPLPDDGVAALAYSGEKAKLSFFSA